MKLKHYLVFLLVFLGTSALFAQSQASYKNTQAIAKLIEKNAAITKPIKRDSASNYTMDWKNAPRARVTVFKLNFRERQPI